MLLLDESTSNSTNATVQNPRGQNHNNCQHCGLPSGSEKFCCLGCEAIYLTLHELNLQEFYDKISFSLPGKELSVRPETPKSPQQFLEFDALKDIKPGFYIFSLTGIHCAGCIWILERLPKINISIKNCSLNLTKGTILVEYDETSIKLSEIAALLSSLGYTPKRPRNFFDDQDKDKSELIRIGVSGFISMNSLLFAVSLFEGSSTGIEIPYGNILRYLSFALAIPDVTYCAYPLYKSALSALKAKILHIDLPIVIAIVAAFILSSFNTITGREFVYFDSLASLIFLMLVSRRIQANALSKAKRDSHLGWSLLPNKIKRVTTDSYELVTLSEIRKKDIILIDNGERIPADGIVRCGNSHLDLSILTGESKLIKVQPSSYIQAGAKNVGERLEFEVVLDLVDTQFGQILEKLNSIPGKKSSIMSLIQNVSKIYVFAVLTLSLVVFCFWFRVGVDVAFQNALSLLIVTCPCALALAYPTAVGLSLSKAAKSGILIKQTDYFERLLSAENIVFDKTGTLTEGTFEVVNEQGDLKVLDRESLVELLSASISHPVSAILSKHLNLTLKKESNLAILRPGQGVEYKNKEGNIWRIGSLSWMRALNITLTHDEKIFEWDAQGFTLALIAKNNSVIAAFALSDRERRDLRSMFDFFKQLKFNLLLLSGDTEQSVNKFSRKFSEYFKITLGGLLPENKAKIISESPNSVFIGDGVNDILAMKVSSLGVTLSGGIAETIDSSDVVITKNPLESIINLFKIAKRTKQIIVISLLVSLAYNLSAAILASLGLITPLIGAVLMPLSSLTIIGIVVFGSK